jgi:hypothetical protein
MKYSHWLFKLPLIRNYSAICIGRTIYFRDAKEDISPVLMKHEMVHIEQMDRVGIVSFYLIYIRDYVKNLIKYRDHWKAYYNIPFELEAYRRQNE